MDSGDLARVIARVYGGLETMSGVEVSPAMAMRWPPFGISVRVISETVGQLPSHVFQKKRSEGRPSRSELPDHWLAWLMDRPNSWQTGQEFREFIIRNACSIGNAFALKIRDGVDKVRELLPIPAHRIVSVTQDDKWNLVYSVSSPGGEVRDLKADRIFHIRGPSDDGMLGNNTVMDYKEAIALGIAQDRHAATIFGNGGMPRGFLESPGNLSPKRQKNLIDSIKEQTGGAKSNSWMILPGGMKASSPVIDPDKAQLLDSRKLQRGIVAAILRVPLHAVGDLEKANYSSIESMARQFVDYSLLPWIIRLEKGVYYQLLSERSRSQGIFMKLSLNSLLRGSSDQRKNFYHSAILDGWMTRNEARALEDMDAGPEELDSFWQPVNIAAVGEGQDVAPPAPPPLNEGPFQLGSDRDYMDRLEEAIQNGH